MQDTWPGAPTMIFASPNRCARCSRIPEVLQADLACPDNVEEIFPFSAGANQSHLRNRLTHRGADRDRHERGLRCGGRGSVGALVVAGRIGQIRERLIGRAGRTALQRLLQNFGRQHMADRGDDEGRCVRRSRVVLASVADVKLVDARGVLPDFERTSSTGDGDKRNSSPGRARRKPLKPLRGECRVSGVPVVTAVCLTPCTRAAGAAATRRFPAPSFLLGECFSQNSGASCRENDDSHLVVPAKAGTHNPWRP